MPSDTTRCDQEPYSHVYTISPEKLINRDRVVLVRIWGKLRGIYSGKRVAKELLGMADTEKSVGVVEHVHRAITACGKGESRISRAFCVKAIRNEKVPAHIAYTSQTHPVMTSQNSYQIIYRLRTAARSNNAPLLPNCPAITFHRSGTFTTGQKRKQQVNMQLGYLISQAKGSELAASNRFVWSRIYSGDKIETQCPA